MEAFGPLSSTLPNDVFAACVAASAAPDVGMLQPPFDRKHRRRLDPAPARRAVLRRGPRDRLLAGLRRRAGSDRTAQDGRVGGTGLLGL